MFEIHAFSRTKSLLLVSVESNSSNHYTKYLRFPVIQTHGLSCGLDSVTKGPRLAGRFGLRFIKLETLDALLCISLDFFGLRALQSLSTGGLPEPFPKLWVWDLQGHWQKKIVLQQTCLSSLCNLPLLLLFFSS